VRKFLALFLIVLLPLQWSWAVSAAPCDHEVTAHPAHFGHHGPSHGEPAGPLDAVGSAAADLGDDGHADCGTCQLGSATAVLSNLRLIMAATADSLSATVRALWPNGHPDVHFRPPLHTAT
jgi:hypothetical protein